MKLQEEKIKKIIELRKQGLSYSRIARELGISELTVSLYCNPEKRKKHYQRSKVYQKKLYKEDNERYSYYMARYFSKKLGIEYLKKLSNYINELKSKKAGVEKL
ncbi:MAG: hypothetical protein QXL14_01910 [Candidatus Aenigmatarchaeota archaeon]